MENENGTLKQDYIYMCLKYSSKSLWNLKTDKNVAINCPSDILTYLFGIKFYCVENQENTFRSKYGCFPLEMHDVYHPLKTIQAFLSFQVPQIWQMNWNLKFKPTSSFSPSHKSEHLPLPQNQHRTPPFLLWLPPPCFCF